MDKIKIIYRDSKNETVEVVVTGQTEYMDTVTRIRSEGGQFIDGKLID